MCMQFTPVRPYQRWNWGGDEIVSDTVIPASRTIPGTRKKRYDIDIREYLSIQDNAVIRAHWHRLLDRLPQAEQARLTSRKEGTFDFRARKVAEYVGGLRYRPVGRRFDEWLFPDETLAQGGGDCEDLAFVLAALLEASGISSYCIRVALGTVVSHADPKKPQRWDHAWVVYKNEGGAWEILEPLALTAGPRSRLRRAPPRGPFATRKVDDVEYIPHFVFNRAHLWRVRTPERVAARPFREYVKEERQFLKRFAPSFAVRVHESIFATALAGMPANDLDAVKRASLGVDVNVLQYDPRDHFDFAYIDESWALVQRRLKTGDVKDFALASHAIADFYAHSFYADFAKRRDDGSIVPYDPSHPLRADRLTYDFTRYAPFPGRCNTVQDAAAYWRGRLISGQWWRWYSTFPDELEKAGDFHWRRCLPDHDAVAVDGPRPRSAHRHYNEQEFQVQFRLRQGAAVEHIRNVYRSWIPRKTA